ncbi:Muramoyltetrapeptide carboxypeptidase [Chondromyces apiculatus DSM 436]|uniref:Muramoyltetrapeptide carboxypeptidase n=2 Tax=Chondromyces apiculatus TaxID=51 RepID=A0A017T0S4_9BACT|nr:Muramoyltetrapeptide carboxypeptidase [Chondromyces apiculatus DSM 436]
MEAGAALLEAWGYVPVLGPNLRAQHRYLAGTAEERGADLRWALTSPDVDAVYVARGGYGCVHLLPGIPWAEVVPGRMVVGFSDVTALLLALHQRTQAVAVHAPTLGYLATKSDAATREAVREVLAGGRETVLRGEVRAEVRGGGTEGVEGPVLGGNLCVLASLAGTRWRLQAEGALLVLEDVNEAPYRLDRMVVQLVESGALSGVRAVLLGEFVGCAAPAEAGWTLEELLVDLMAPLGVPIVTGVGVGHGPRNLPFFYGGQGLLEGGVLRVGRVLEAEGARRPATFAPA